MHKSQPHDLLFYLREPEALLFSESKNAAGLSTSGRLKTRPAVSIEVNLSLHLSRAKMNEQDYIQRLEKMNQQLLDQVTQLTLELREMKRLLFGSKSERFVPEQVGGSPQLDLQLLMEEAAKPAVITQEVKLITHVQSPARSAAGRQALPAHLQREDTVLEPEVDTTGMKKIGEEITEQLDYRPGKLVVKRIIRPKYAKVTPDGTGYTEVFIAELPAFAVEKGMAAAGLLAQIIVDKQVDHLPIHRQIKRYQRDGVKLAASTVDGWYAGAYQALLPVGEMLKKVVLSSGYLQADETGLPVLRGETRGAAHQGYLWAYHSPPEKLIWYEFEPGRGRAGPINLLKTFSGYLQTDGYSVYENAAIGGRSDITLLHCMAHARRYFEKALDTDREHATHFLQEVQKLYAIERTCREENLSPDETKERRQQLSVQVLSALKEWLTEKYQALQIKSTPLAKAIAYCLSRWDRLSLYTTNGILQIDNNLVENGMRPVALGRKNYLFAGSHDGAKRLALFYSLLESCKKHDVHPWEYLKDILERIPTAKMSELRSMLPDQWKLNR